MQFDDTQELQSPSGPEVVIDVLGDGHFEPDTTEKINLGIELFPGWSRMEGESLLTALRPVASRESAYHSYCGHEICSDPLYFEGLKRYIDALAEPGGAALYDTVVLSSIMRHSFGRRGGGKLEDAVEKLIIHPVQEVQGYALQWIIGAFTENKRLQVSHKIAEAIIQGLPSAHEKYQASLLQLLDATQRKGWIEKAYDAATKMVESNPCAAVLAQAIIFLRDSCREKTHSIMQHYFETTKEATYATGIAAAALLKRDGANETLRQTVRERIDDPTYRWEGECLGICASSRDFELGPFTRGLLESHSPAAVALALNHIEAKIPFGFHNIKPIAHLVRKLRDWWNVDTPTRDFNAIMYHLSTVFQPEAAAHAVQTLATSGGYREKQYLHRQLRNPPNRDRESVLINALCDRPQS